MQLSWSQPALRDVSALQAYIAQDNPEAAKRQVALISTGVNRLLGFPELGRPGRRPRTRELVVSKTPFIVAYMLQGEVIHILRVLHSRRRWPEAF